MKTLLLIMTLFPCVVCGEISDLGLKSAYQHRDSLELVLVKQLSDSFTHRGHLTKFPEKIAAHKKLIIGIFVNIDSMLDEQLFVLEDDFDVRTCIKPTERAYYYVLDENLLP